MSSVARSASPASRSQAETWHIYALLGIAVLVLWLVARSRIGRAMEAIREDETAARVAGIDVFTYRMGALVAAAVLAGIAGALDAHSSSFIGPSEFGFEPAVTILSFALLGGIATPFAPVLGAFVLTLLPEVLRDVAGARLIVNGLIIVLVGAVPAARHPALPHAPPRRMSALLELTGVTRRFAGLTAVDNVDLRIEAGGIHAVIGPNGAGKTTLFNLISGLIPPSAGRIAFAGEDVTRRSVHRRAALGLARTFQNIRVFGEMSLLENVLVGLHARLSAPLPAIVLRLPRFAREERDAVSRARAALDFVGLGERAEVSAGSLAYGDQRRLEIARAIAPDPKLVLLDEPAAGMNPAETTALAALVRRIRDRGATVLLIEHHMGFVMQLSEQVTVLNFGRRIFAGTPDAVRAAPVVVEAYLGPKVAARLAGQAA